MAWKADHLQGVLFTVPTSTQMDALQVWSVAFNGKSPDGFRRGDTSLGSPSQADGSIGKYWCSITVSIARVDISILPQQSNRPEFAQIQDFDDGAEQVATILRSLVASIPATRIAFIGNLTEHVESDDKLAERLKEVTGVWFPSPPLDSVYQYNVRRLYECAPAFQMNRVVSWGTGAVQIYASQMNQISLATAVLQKSTPAVTWKIDVNSATDRPLLDSATNVIAESCAELRKIFAEGREHLR